MAGSWRKEEEIEEEEREKSDSVEISSNVWEERRGQRKGQR